MKWNNKFGKIIVFDKERISRFNLNNQTNEFLISLGLPEEAAPFLTFVKDNDIQYEGILRLTDYFEFLEPEFERYIVIGSNGSGDEIVIDNLDHCKIKLLDHEDYFSEQFMNSSIDKLANALIIYQEFIDDVLSLYGNDGFLDGKYSFEQIDQLKSKLIESDKGSISEGSVWLEEIEILIANKNEIR
ncbi:SUKH-4 family immunity protein [Fulvivirgaceae bacterium BMA12]|uniref:SUKH-4 family immunity protein n=1 Tax=Agaribacillus aureus TaxID=3051825 RepID=A0ABT8LIC5_9BACT|nr:SUKH-4 family immunity protein [Fulvivirgaceae bacterium BMA12]